MKKSASLYVLIIVGGIMVLFFLVRNRNPFGKNNTSFAVDADAEITKIELLEGRTKVILSKSGEKWVVNGTSEARKSAVLFIIKTLKEIKIKSPVSGDIFRQEVIDKKVEPVRVNVFTGRKPIKSFYVYRTSSNVYGNIMKLRVSSKPFIVYMPGYENNIGSHFVVNELFWKPFTAINLLPSAIGSVELQNFSDPASSLKIENRGGVFLLKDAPASGQDSLKVKRYISYFVSIPFESWAFDLSESEKKAIEETTPIYVIKVNTATGGVIKLTIWDRFINSGNETSQDKDTDRVWGQLDDGKGIFVMRYFDIDPILKKKSWFERE